MHYYVLLLCYITVYCTYFTKYISMFLNLCTHYNSHKNKPYLLVQPVILTIFIFKIVGTLSSLKISIALHTFFFLFHLPGQLNQSNTNQ